MHVTYTQANNLDEIINYLHGEKINNKISIVW